MKTVQKHKKFMGLEWSHSFTISYSDLSDNVFFIKTTELVPGGITLVVIVTYLIFQIIQLPESCKVFEKIGVENYASNKNDTNQFGT